MKKFFKARIVSLLGWQVRRLRSNHDFKVIAIAGSIGKTSTKFAVAAILGQSRRVRFQDGNYNDLITVPLVFFGHATPSLLNPFAWMKILWDNERQIGNLYNFDIVIVELGTDGPGQLQMFKKYLQADLGILTAISPEHMEFFKDLDDVAAEELSIATLCTKLLINNDLCAEKYLHQLISKPLTYSLKNPADYQLLDIDFQDQTCNFNFNKNGQKILSATHELIAEPQLYSLAAALATATEFGISTEDMAKGINQIKPVSGRMQKLNGINNSIIIDDTYNASPDAMKAALDALYKLAAPQKIAILGNMNELGSFSADAHRSIGEYCDPKQLAAVLTIGNDANEFLAAAAMTKGCQVKSFTNPYELGAYLKSIIKSDALILAKGSQNGVFAEEALKSILADPADAAKLVRQSPYWLKIKQSNYPVTIKS